jgi:hypothetical protein
MPISEMSKMNTADVQPVPSVVNVRYPSIRTKVITIWMYTYYCVGVIINGFVVVDLLFFIFLLCGTFFKEKRIAQDLPLRLDLRRTHR